MLGGNVNKDKTQPPPKHKAVQKLVICNEKVKMKI